MLLIYIFLYIFLIGSPFVLEVEDGTLVEAKGRGCEASPVDTLSSFFIDASRAHFIANVNVAITGEYHMSKHGISRLPACEIFQAFS